MLKIRTETVYERIYGVCVCLLLVSGLGGDMVLDAVLAERVETGERLGVLVALEADLADEKLVVNLLSELRARRRRHLELMLLRRYVWTHSSADRLQHIVHTASLVPRLST